MSEVGYTLGFIDSSSEESVYNIELCDSDSELEVSFEEGDYPSRNQQHSRQHSFKIQQSLASLK